MVSCRMDVVDLRNFYAHPLGTMARRLIGRGIRRLWTGSTGLRVLGIGYAPPYLGLFRDEAERCLAFMPAAQGVVKWPSSRPTLAALVDDWELPLADAAVDRILLVHALETSHDAAALLRDSWRVLAPGGRILAVVPNRRGLWARMDTTPFGQGQPFSRGQLTAVLREAMFSPVHWDEALYVPPIPRHVFLASAVAWERLGTTLALPFAGVHVIEATKTLYRPVAVRQVRRVPARVAPVLVPASRTASCRDAGCPSLD
jgi:SAM-dependent methyltransferase